MFYIHSTWEGNWRALSLSLFKLATHTHYAHRPIPYQASQHQHSAELSCWITADSADILLQINASMLATVEELGASLIAISTGFFSSRWIGMWNTAHHHESFSKYCDTFAGHPAPGSWPGCRRFSNINISVIFRPNVKEFVHIFSKWLLKYSHHKANTRLTVSLCTNNIYCVLYLYGTWNIYAESGSYWQLQLGRASLNPARLSSGTPASKVEVPPLGTLKWGDFNFPDRPACKVEVPLLCAQV